MIRFFPVTSVILALLTGLGPVFAQSSVEQHMPLDGRIAADGRSVELNWSDTPRPRKGQIRISRRDLGQTGAASWQVIAPSPGVVMRYTDRTIRPGAGFEYKVEQLGRDIIDVGYWVTGVELPVQDRARTAYLVIDETVADPLAPRLARFSRDLVGAGWRVIQVRVPRGVPGDPKATLARAGVIKTWLHEQYGKTPFGSHAVILIGHVPMVLSGRANPDGHEAVPHVTDLFYGDVDGRWRIAPDGVLRNNRLPSDFIEMQVGRIDFSGVSEGDPARELFLLRSYFDKTHHWRMGLIGDVRRAYGQNEHLTAELYGLRNIVGPHSVTTGGHHDAGESGPWLWGVDFGDWDGRAYAAKYANQAVFALNFGSAKQKIEAPFNPMTALLAQPWYPIAVGWGARPAWWLHHMALGSTIGEVHMRTVNNGRAEQPYRDSMDYYPTGRYLWRNPVWVNLLGDPTTHAFVLTPPSGLRAVSAGQEVTLTWTASRDPDVLGYRVYRSLNGATSFTLISGPDPVAGTEFTDRAPTGNTRYMIRAYGLKQVYAGSFFTLSQGVFAPGEEAGLVAGEIAITTPRDQPVPLPARFSRTEDGRIHAIIAPPVTGELTFDGQDWRYTPPPGFSGVVELRYSLSDALQTDEGRVRITVQN